MEKHGLDMRSYVQGRRACSVCELARALVNCGRSMKIATFSTRDLQEQYRKSYVASYRANKELVISRTTSIKIIRESFLP